MNVVIDEHRINQMTKELKVCQLISSAVKLTCWNPKLIYRNAIFRGFARWRNPKTIRKMGKYYGVFN